MPQRITLTAFLVANQLDIKGIKNFLDIKPLADSSSELFYGFGGGKYQYYFNYGVVVFSGYTLPSSATLVWYGPNQDQGKKPPASRTIRPRSRDLTLRLEPLTLYVVRL